MRWSGVLQDPHDVAVEVFNTCAAALAYDLRGFEEVVCKTRRSHIAIKLLL